MPCPLAAPSGCARSSGLPALTLALIMSGPRALQGPPAEQPPPDRRTCVSAASRCSTRLGATSIWAPCSPSSRISPTCSSKHPQSSASWGMARPGRSAVPRGPPNAGAHRACSAAQEQPCMRREEPIGARSHAHCSHVEAGPAAGRRCAHLAPLDSCAQARPCVAVGQPASEQLSQRYWWAATYPTPTQSLSHSASLNRPHAKPYPERPAGSHTRRSEASKVCAINTRGAPRKSRCVAGSNMKLPLHCTAATPSSCSGKSRSASSASSRPSTILRGRELLGHAHTRLRAAGGGAGAFGAGLASAPRVKCRTRAPAALPLGMDVQQRAPAALRLRISAPRYRREAGHLCMKWRAGEGEGNALHMLGWWACTAP